MKDYQFENADNPHPNQLNSDRQCVLLPVEFFKTEEARYIFDAGNVVFLEVTPVVFDILSIWKHKTMAYDELVAALPQHSAADITQALSEIKEIQREGFLIRHDFERANPYSPADIREHLTGKMEGIYLNITSKCNLSCSYCIYGGEYNNTNHLQYKEMSWETAQKAIDFILPKTNKEKTIRVDFFGGEPLLAFSLMKRIVNKVEKEFQRRNQEFEIYISSNGTVLNDEILDFLIRYNVNLQISIDGQKKIHDAKRKFRTNNNGSFDKILRNLQSIYDRSSEYFETKIRLKSVITTESVEAHAADFFDIPLIKILTDKKQFSMINQTPLYDVKKDRDYFERLHILGKILLRQQNVSTIDELLSHLDYKQRYFFYMSFYEFFPIQIISRLYFDRQEPVPFSKDCLIGIEGCVNVDGSISICYKANSFIIGNVIDNTWNYDKILEIHDKRYHHSKQCKHCFVQRFCRMCYEVLTENNIKLEKSLQNFCEFNRHYYKVIFQYMLKVMEKNPNLWDELTRLAKEETDHIKTREC